VCCAASETGPRLTRAWQEMEQITIGAIEGFCIGGGVALAVALDFGSWPAMPISACPKSALA